MTQPKLPVILIGPILRRVEPRSVSVFVATSKAAAIELLIYDGIVDADNPPAVHASANARTIAVLANFHATVVTASIDGADVLQPGHRYSYNLRVTLDGGAAQSLKDLGLLTDSELPAYFSGPGDPDQRTAPIDVTAIGYADGQLPSFVTCPATLDDLVLVHASCRKPHGQGNPALQYIDDLIDDLHGADTGRPQMMFLTGDQIYADDVAIDQRMQHGMKPRKLACEFRNGFNDDPQPRQAAHGRAQRGLIHPLATGIHAKRHAQGGPSYGETEPHRALRR